MFTGLSRPTEVEGLATFDKKVILFGSEGNAKTFRSKYEGDKTLEVELFTWEKLDYVDKVKEAFGL